MNIAAAHFEEEPNSQNHWLLRETASAGGELIEGRYFLSWATGVNEFRRSHEEFDADYREFVVKTWPAARVFLASCYWRMFFLVLLRQRYRESSISADSPIQNETKQDQAVRMFLMNPSLSQTELANNLRTTEKQLLRMSMLQLAIRESTKSTAYPEQSTTQRKR